MTKSNDLSINNVLTGLKDSFICYFAALDINVQMHKEQPGAVAPPFIWYCEVRAAPLVL